MQWKVLPRVSEDIREQLLHNRGLKSKKTIEGFFHPDLGDYKSDLEISGIEEAQKRILKATAQAEQIIVYGDYDVDGISATTIIYKALSSLGAKILPFIPHRERDGYGLSKSGLDSIKQTYPDTKVVITVDNGIVAIDQAKYAKQLGFDLIITDHHLPLSEKPECFALVHSTKMCGAAVAWCLARSLISEDLSRELLQFAAIGTIADQIPLIGLGRAIAKEGLEEINKTRNPGLKALATLAGIEIGKIGSYEIGHIIAPKLNAAGRLDTAMPSLKLLCTNKVTKAADLANKLMEANTSRQDLTTKAIEEASLQLNSKNQIHIVYSKEWISGIIGLVAGRLAEDYRRPAIAISVGEVIAKGSARSIDGVNIVETLRKASDLLIDVGGHSGAAGFSLDPGRVEEFKIRVEELIAVQGIGLSDRVLEIEAEILGKEINLGLIEMLKEFEPFGLGNPKPLLLTKGMRVEDFKTVGSGKHLKLILEGKEAIAFGMGEVSNVLKLGQLVDVAFYPEINRFNGREKLQLRVKDLHTN